MKTINLDILAQLHGNNSFSAFETVYSRREKNETRECEQNSLYALVQYLENICHQTIKNMNGFYFSYTIPQISKEFDLLRFSEDSVLDIELKSHEKPLDEIYKQLHQNFYYLRHLQKEAYLFTFFDDNRLYKYDKGTLREGKPEELIEALSKTEKYMDVDIDTLFKPSQFLISPLTTPERFLNDEYFLTSQQEMIRKQILEEIMNHNSGFFGINGKPGTGKTLVLYDLAKELAKKKRCCIVHCAPLCDGHSVLNDNMHNCKIIIPKDFTSSEFDYEQYDVILFDEFHRAYENVLDKILELERCGKQAIILSYDFGQRITRLEKSRNLEARIQACDKIKVLRLTDKIRTNKELAQFIGCIFNPRKYYNANEKRYDFANVEVIFSNNREQTKEIIKLYTDMGYVHINHSVSLHRQDQFDSLNTTPYNAHKVFGMEFEKVLVVMNSAFFYENGILKGRDNTAHFDYLYAEMLYEEMTRVREKLCIIVEDNIDLLNSILAYFPCIQS